MDDPHNLQRFLDAQEPIFENVLAELVAEQKRSHWMWYIFPQIRGLGHSPMSQMHAIQSKDEAQAYAQHPILGNRLRECTQCVINIEGREIGEIFGYPDDMKFHSSMTLFALAAADNALFQQALAKYFGGKLDRNTVAILGQ